MKTQDAVAFFGTKIALANAFTPPLTKGAVSNWGDVIPRGRAFELQNMTNGKLKVDPSLYQKPKNAA